MINYIRRPGAFALVLACAIAACSTPEKKADTTLASDTALKSDLAMANRDTTAQPALNDVPANAGSPAPTANAPKTSAPKTSTPRTTPPKATPRPAPAKPVAAAPTTTTTASGNTVTRNPAGSGSSSAGGSVGTIASGTSLALRSNARVCTNTYQVGQTFSATVANAVSGPPVPRSPSRSRSSSVART